MPFLFSCQLCANAICLSLAYLSLTHSGGSSARSCATVVEASPRLRASPFRHASGPGRHDRKWLLLCAYRLQTVIVIIVVGFA